MNDLLLKLPDMIDKLLVALLSVVMSLVLPFSKIAILLIIAILIDTIFGIAVSIKYKTFSSQRLKRIVKKLGYYFAILLLVVIFDNVILITIHLPFTFAAMFCLIIIFMELASTLENLNDLGFNIPFTGLLSKIRTTIPILSITPELDDSDRLIEEATRIIGKERAAIYEIWIIQLNSIIRELNEKDQLKNDKFAKEIINLRISSLLKISCDKDYSDYLMKITKEINLKDKQLIYVMANKGLNYEKQCIC